MSEFITIQVGQCGNQIGRAFWPLVLQEHGFRPYNDGESILFNKTPKQRTDNLHSFFHLPNDTTSLKNLADIENNKVKARVLCIDMEERVVDKFSTCRLKHLFDNNFILKNNPGSGNNWAEGFYTHGRQYKCKIYDLIRKSVEKCDSLHGFLLLFSMGGGTGSGLGSATMNILNEYFPEIERFATCVYPAGYDDVITSPYNVALATKVLSDCASCVFPIDNKSLLDITSRFHQKNSICKPYQDMNSVIANMLLHLTSGSRFPGSLNMDMNELATNMVPYPGMHFISSSVYPILNSEISSKISLKVDDMFNNCLGKESQLMRFTTTQGSVLGTTFVGRGDISLGDLRRNIDKYSLKIRTLCSYPSLTKVALCSTPPPDFDKSLLCLINSTNILSFFKDISQKFQKLYCRKAHLHHYLNVDGFEKQDFDDSLENLESIINNYSQMENAAPIQVPRLKVH